jgi:hypothetical protein
MQKELNYANSIYIIKQKSKKQIKNSLVLEKSQNKTIYFPSFCSSSHF